MAGLLQKQMAPPAAAPVPTEQPVAPEQKGAPAEGEQTASPEEQAQYEKVVLAGVQVLYDEKTHPEIVKMLQTGANDPAMAIASAAVTVLTAIVQKAKPPIPEEILFEASTEILGEIVDLAEKAKIFTADEAVMTKALQQFMEQSIQQQIFTPEFMQSILSQFDETETQEIVAEQDQIYKGSQPQASAPAPKGAV